MKDLKPKVKICKNGVLQIFEPRDPSQLQLFDVGKYKLRTLKFDKVWREQGFVKVMQNGRYGLYDNTGKELFAPEYVKIEICALGFVVYYNTDSTSEFYDINGEKHEQLCNSNVVDCFTKHKILHVNFLYDVRSYVLYSLESKSFLSYKWSSYLDCKDKVFLFDRICTTCTVAQVFLKKKGMVENTVFMMPSRKTFSYSLGKNKSGSIKIISATKCEDLVKAIYDLVWFSTNKTSIVIKNRRTGLVNHDGRIILPCKYDYVVKISDSTEKNPFYLYGNKWLLGLASSTEVLLEPIYSDIYSISEGVYCVELDDEKWTFDCKTKTLSAM